MPSRSLRRQQIVIAALAVILAGVGVGVPLAQHLTRPRLTAPERVASYQVTYRVTSLASGSGATTSWELLTVHRPFDSSDLTYRARPAPGAVPESGSVFTEDTLYAYQGGDLHPVAGRQPGPGGNDEDLGTQLPDLEARGLVRDLGRTQQLAGTSCELYRFSGPPSGAVAPFSGADHDDLCLDPRGIELGEDWTYRGRVVEERAAVALSVGRVTDPVDARALHAAGRPAAGSGAPLAAPDPTATTFLPAPPVPPNFRRAVVERFVEPDPENPGGLLAASVVWAFTDGPDVITVEAGQGAPGQLPWSDEPTRAEPVTLAGLGAAQSAIRSDGAEVRVDLGGGRWVRIRGTVPVAGLVVYAGTLRPPA